MENGQFFTFRIDFINDLRKIYPAREAENITNIVFQDILGYSKTDLSSKKELLLEENDRMTLNKILERLMQHEPVQYILGHTYFYDLKLKVNNSVLIPRPETEELADWIIKDYSTNDSKLKVLDIGTGSGCIALALKKHLPTTQIDAIDNSKAAIAIAKENGIRLNINVNFMFCDVLNSDDWKSIPKYDIIVSNPPYILIQEKPNLPKNVANYEPAEALFVNNDNALEFYDAIIDFAKKHMKKGGEVRFEIHEMMGASVNKLMIDKGLSEITLRKDLSGKDRMIKVAI